MSNDPNRTAGEKQWDVGHGRKRAVHRNSGGAVGRRAEKEESRESVAGIRRSQQVGDFSTGTLVVGKGQPVRSKEK